MDNFIFKKINAFTDGASPGNPAACIYLYNHNSINENQMQLIAKELKGFVNEVVYLFPEEDSVFLKYYSSECEVDFCGHGTIAIMHDYIKNNNYLFNSEIINIRVKNNILKVYNHIKQDNSVYITAPYQNIIKMNIGYESIIKSLNINPESINNNYELAIINAGLNTLIVPINHLNACLEMLPDINTLKLFCTLNNIDIILVFTNEVSNSDNNYRTRVFAPKFGYLEDPATGSGNSAFGYYLLNYNLWNGNSLLIEQNNSKETPNIIKLNTITNNNNKYIIFGGSAVVKIEGTYKLN